WALPSACAHGASDTGRSLGALAGGVGADGRADDDLAGVDDDVAAGDLEPEAVEAAGRRATALLADPVVLGSVARALEPLRAVAPRHAAPEVHALLVQRDIPLLHAGQHLRVRRDLLRLGEVLLRVGDD